MLTPGTSTRDTKAWAIKKNRLLIMEINAVVAHTLYAPNGHLEVCKVLIAAKADVAAKNSRFGPLPLRKCAQSSCRRLPRTRVTLVTCSSERLLCDVGGNSAMSIVLLEMTCTHSALHTGSGWFRPNQSSPRHSSVLNTCL